MALPLPLRIVDTLAAIATGLLPQHFDAAMADDVDAYNARYQELRGRMQFGAASRTAQAELVARIIEREKTTEGIA